MKQVMIIFAAIGIGLMAPVGYGQFGGFGVVGDSPLVSPAQPHAGVGDFDGDGLKDFIYLNQQSDIVIRFGTPDATISTDETALPFLNGQVAYFGQHREIQVADLDGDGLDDFAIAASGLTNGSVTGIRWVIGFGADDRMVASAITANAALSGSEPLGSGLGDIDNDGDLDLLVIGEEAGAGRVYLVENIGARQFAEGRSIAGPFGSLRGLGVGDLNNDGVVEMITRSGGSILLLTDINLDGEWNLVDTLTGTNFGSNNYHISDFDGDDINDIFAYIGANPNPFIRVWHHDGNFGFTVTDSGGAGGRITDEAGSVGDIDGDNDLDFIAPRLTSAGGGAVVYQNMGDGSFIELSGVSFGGGSNQPTILLELMDIDNNSTPDIIGFRQSANPPTLQLALNLTDVVTPGPFTLLSPTDGAVDLALPDHYSSWNGGQPEFRWSRPTGFSNSFDLSVWTTADVPTEVYSASGVSGLSHPVPNGVLETGTEYEWRVTANNQAGSTDAMSEHVFTTAPGPRLCEPDLNGDGELNFFDISAFLNAFSAGCP